MEHIRFIPHSELFVLSVFPTLGIHEKNKFDPKTLLCIFVGYSEKHKAYKCFHPSSKFFLISHHVVFDKLTFPYKSIITSCIAANQPHVMSIFYSWLPHANTSSSASILTDSSSPPCLTPLLPIAAHTPKPHFQNSSPIESSHESPPQSSSHIPVKEIMNYMSPQTTLVPLKHFHHKSLMCLTTYISQLNR